MEAVSVAENALRTTRWAVPTIKGRGEVLDELHELVATPEWLPRLVVLEGPRGAGTTTLAREFVADARTAFRGWGKDPAVIHVDVSSLKHAKGDPCHGVAAAIFHHFQQDLPVQGSSTGRIVWWSLRRIVAQSKPVIVWLDQVHEGTRTLAGVLEPLLEPERFLEKGASVPPILVVVSGNGKADLGSWPESVPTKWIHVPLLPRPVVEEIVVERAQELGCEISPGAVAKVLSIMVTRGRGLSLMGEVLKASADQAGLRQDRTVTEQDIPTPRISVRGASSKHALEVRVLEILRQSGGELAMGELMEQLTQELTRGGEAHRTGSTLRRLFVRLEKLGLVERQVKMGGEGGTRSVVALTSGHPSPAR